MPRKIKHQPDPALKDLPMYIHKQQDGRYMNVRTGEKIATRDLHKHLPIQPEQDLASKGRWDLNY